MQYKRVWPLTLLIMIASLFFNYTWADPFLEDEDQEMMEKTEGDTDEVVLPELPPFEVPYDPNLPTKRVLVSSFEIGIPGLPASLKIEKGLKAQLITVLSKMQNFQVIDRDALKDLRNELILKKAGAVTSESAVTAGKLLGAQVIIKAVVTEFSENVKGKSTGTKVSLGQMAEVAGVVTGSEALDVVAAANPEIGGGKETITGVVGLDIRLIDINTGEIIESFDARGEITRKNAQSLFGIAGITTISKEFEKTVIGQAARLAIRDAVVKIFNSLKRMPWRGLVAAVKQDGTVIINAGRRQNIHVGQGMYVKSEGEKITDPSTGMVIYTEYTKTAEIEIISVKDSVSFGRVLRKLSKRPIRRGDIVVLK